MLAAAVAVSVVSSCRAGYYGCNDRRLCDLQPQSGVTHLSVVQSLNMQDSERIIGCRHFSLIALKLQHAAGQTVSKFLLLDRTGTFEIKTLLLSADFYWSA